MVSKYYLREKCTIKLAAGKTTRYYLCVVVIFMKAVYAHLERRKQKPPIWIFLEYYQRKLEYLYTLTVRSYHYPFLFSVSLSSIEYALQTDQIFAVLSSHLKCKVNPDMKMIDHYYHRYLTVTPLLPYKNDMHLTTVTTVTYKKEINRELNNDGK